MTTYNTVNTAAFDQYMPYWPAGEPAPNEVDMGIALCMPSVSKGGVRAKHGMLRVTGQQALYNAFALSQSGCNDRVWAAFQTAYNKAVGSTSSPSTKTNHIQWLTEAKLVTSHQAGRGQPRHTYLTDAGLAEVKAFGGAELAKLAKAYTAEARAKAVKAAERVTKQALRPTRETVATEAIDEALISGATVDLDNEGYAVVVPADQPEQVVTE